MMAQSHTSWYVEHGDLLRKLSGTEQALFQQEGTLLSIQKGDTLTTEPNDCVFIIVKGYVKLVTISPEGKRFSISILKTGDFLGSLLFPQPATPRSLAEASPEFIEAIVPSQVLRVSCERFKRVLQENPTLYLTILQNLEGKTRLFQRKLSDLLFRDVHSRIAQLLLELTFEHGTPCPYAFGLHKDISLKHHEIAELIGASRPVTSIALGQFLKADLIHKHDGQICLQDIKALQEVAAEGFSALNLKTGTKVLAN